MAWNDGGNGQDPWKNEGGQPNDLDKIEIVQGDITLLAVDAIVNAGNLIFSTGNQPFFAVATLDSGGSANDWGFALIPEDVLTPWLIVCDSSRKSCQSQSAERQQSAI